MCLLAKDGGGMLVRRVTRLGAAPPVLSVLALLAQKYKYGHLSSTIAAQEDGTGYWQAHR